LRTVRTRTVIRERRVSSEDEVRALLGCRSSRNVQVMGEGGRACDDSEAEEAADAQGDSDAGGDADEDDESQERRGAGEGVA
jgi:hypothetical protein